MWYLLYNEHGPKMVRLSISSIDERELASMEAKAVWDLIKQESNRAVQDPQLAWKEPLEV